MLNIESIVSNFKGTTMDSFAISQLRNQISEALKAYAAQRVQEESKPLVEALELAKCYLRPQGLNDVIYKMDEIVGLKKQALNQDSLGDGK